MKKITHLVFAGNALRTLCLGGILRYIYFYKMDNDIRNVSGTSMGAFFALAFALKIPIETLETYLYDLCKQKSLINFKPSSFINILNDYGLNSSIDYLSKFKEYVKEKYQQDDITFIELSKKTGVNLFVSTTNINNGTNVMFNVNDTPNISVFEAVAASMCVPVLSKPVIIDGFYYVDGYLTNNFPYEVFDNIDKNNILGVVVKVDNDYCFSEEYNKKNYELSFQQYTCNLIYLIYLNSNKLVYLNKINEFKDPLIISKSPINSIYEPNIDNECIDIGISDENINNLLLQGFTEMNEYMKKHNEQKEINLEDYETTYSNKSEDLAL
jgi:predicted acylesterase/phospholipase RssA